MHWSRNEIIKSGGSMLIALRDTKLSGFRNFRIVRCSQRADVSQYNSQIVNLKLSYMKMTKIEFFKYNKIIMKYVYRTIYKLKRSIPQ